MLTLTNRLSFFYLGGTILHRTVVNHRGWAFLIPSSLDDNPNNRSLDMFVSRRRGMSLLLVAILTNPSNSLLGSARVSPERLKSLFYFLSESY